jgi:glycosyltransferase involved in cell wall biosynthesis
MPHRILYACETAQISGAEIVLLNLIGSLDRTLFEPRALSAPGGPMPRRLAALGVPVETIRFPWLRGAPRSALLEWPRLPSFSRRLQAYLRDRQVDILHTNSWGAQLTCADAALAAGVVTVWHMHAILKHRWPNAWVMRRAARSADRIICVSRAVARELEAFGVPPHKLVVIHNGLDLAGRFRPRSATGLLRAQFGLPLNARLVGMIGQLALWKGQHIFLHAAAIAAKSQPDAVFLIIGEPLFGDTGYQARLIGLARAGGIEGRVIFAGRRDDMPEVLAELDLVVHASVLPDSLPTVLIEAGAAGKPVVATAAGGVPEIVNDGGSGLLVPPGDADAMAAAIDRLLSNRDAAAAMGEAARRIVEQRFTIERFAGRIQELYRELLNAPVAGPAPNANNTSSSTRDGHAAGTASRPSSGDSGEDPV